MNKQYFNSLLYNLSRVVFLFFIFWSLLYVKSAESSENKRYLSGSEFKIDRIISEMSVREKIAQLFIVAFSSDNQDKSTIESIEMVQKEGIGGVILMNSELEEGVEMINYLQSVSRIPLLVTIDGEWGPSMRFDTLIQYPRQMQLGALGSDSLIFEMGYAIGKQLKRLGVHLNYAPTIDVNNNPDNPVINTRSFGEDMHKVAEYGIAYYRGMEYAGIPGCVKHFPGHGDTDADSHFELPLIPYSYERLDSLELYPFKRLIEKGVEMVMVGHLQIPSLDSTGRPSSVSFPIVSDLLRRDLEFGGIIVTDALNMQGVKAFKSSEYLPLEAYKAGSDFLLMPENPVKAIDIMVKAVRKGEISEHSLNVRVRKMLKLKESIGILEQAAHVDTIGLYEDLTNASYRSLVSELSFKSITLLKNDNNFVPFVNLSDESTGYLSVGGDENGDFLANQLLSFDYCDTIVLRKEILNVDTLYSALNELSLNDRIIIAVHDTDSRPQKQFGIDSVYYSILTSFAKENDVVFVYFGNPLALSLIDGFDNFKAIMISFQNTYYNNLATANILFGASGAYGALPVSTASYESGSSITTKGNIRQEYRMPYPVSDDYDKLISIVDSLIMSDIDNGKYSKSQLVLMDNGNIIHKAFYGDMDIDSLFSFNVGRIEGLLSLIPSVLKLRDMDILSFEDVYNGNLISDYLMNRVGKDGFVTDEPLFARDNELIIKDIISSKSGSDYIAYAKDEFWDKIGVYNVKYNDDGDMLTDANEVAKLLFMFFNGGKYGELQLLEEESADFASLLLHYYSRGLNGSMVWTDSEYKRAVIFLNNASCDSDDRLKLYTPDLIRRSYLDFLKKEGQAF